MSATSSRYKLADIFTAKRQQEILAVVLVLFIALNSVANAELVRYYLEINPTFHAYYLLTYCQASAQIAVIIVILPIEIVRFLLQRRSISKGPDQWGTNDDSPTIYLEFVRYINDLCKVDSTFSWKRIIYYPMILAFLSFTQTFAWFVSLSYVAVAINATMYRMSIIWVWIFSLVFFRKTQGLLNALSVCICLVGLLVVFVSRLLELLDISPFSPDVFPMLHDPSHFIHTLSMSGSITDFCIGILLIFLSTLLDATYDIVYKKAVGGGSSSAKPFLAGLISAYIGLFTLIAAFLPGLALYLLGQEGVVPWTSSAFWMFLLSNTLIAVTWDLAYSFGIMLVNPLYMAVSTLLGIPVGVGADFILHAIVQSPLTLAGMVVLCGGITIMQCDAWRRGKKGSDEEGEDKGQRDYNPL